MAWKVLASKAIDGSELEAQLELITAPNGSPTSPKQEVCFSASGSYHSPQADLGRKAEGAEGMQKAQNIYEFHPQGGEGQVPDMD